MDPKAALKQYLVDNEIKPAEFARLIEYDRGNFHNLLKPDTFWPSLELALRIDRATAGKIPMSAWAEAKAA